MTVSAASLRDLQDQLSQAEDSLNRYYDLQKKAANTSASYTQEITGLENQIASVKNSIRDYEGRINDKETSIKATNQDIATKSAELNRVHQDLNDSLASLYELTNLSSVEVASDGQDISRYADRSEYLQSLQERIISTIEEMSRVKADLESKRTSLEAQRVVLAKLKGEQEARNASLQTKQHRQSGLLQQSKADEAKYRELVKKLSSERDDISKEIYALRQKLAQQNQEIYLTGSSGYPYSAINSADSWLFLTRQCTSYVAWKWNVVYGRSFENTRPGKGSAWNWPALARDQGYQVVDKPQSGAIVSWDRAPAMPYGHAAIVEGVNDDGTINVSEYNWNPPFGYSERRNVSYADYGRARFIVP